MSVRNDHELPRSQADVSDYGHTWTDQSPVEVQEAIRRAECLYVPFFSVIAIAKSDFADVRRSGIVIFPDCHLQRPFASALHITSVTPSVLKGNSVGNPLQMLCRSMN